MNAPPRDIETGDRIEGSYRQVLCLLQQGKDMPPCAMPAAGAAIDSLNVIVITRECGRPNLFSGKGKGVTRIRG